MVLNALFSFGIWIFEMITSTMPSTIPVVYSASNLFSDLLRGGIWVIGEDCWLAVTTMVSAWLTFKMIWGTVLFIYRLIPLT